MSTQPAQPRHALFAATLVMLAGSAGAQAQVPDPGEAVQALLQVAEAEVAAAQALLAGLPQEAQEALAEHLAAAQAALQDAQGTVGDVAEQAMQRAEAELAAAQALVEGLPSVAQQALAEHLAAAQRTLAEAQAAALAAVRDARDQARSAACPASRDALLAGPLVVWTNCNMGAGSGLDADTLDGFQALDFLDRIAAEAEAREAGDSRLADALASEAAAREAADGAEAAARRAAAAGLQARIDSVDAGVPDRAWSAVLQRDGPGSGLDADLLDGLSSHAFARAGHEHDDRYFTEQESEARYLGIAGKAADADLLDGINGKQLLRNDISGSVRGDLSITGNLGLGTHPIVSPESRLHVVGGAGPDTLSVSAAAAGESQALSFWNADGDRFGSISAVRTAANYGAHTQPGDLSIVNFRAGRIVFNVDTQTRSNAPTRMTIVSSGDVGIGTTSPAARLHVAGDIRADGHIFAHSGQHIGDVAEPVVGQGLEPGDVVVLALGAADGKVAVERARQARDRLVAGVVSENPSLRLAGLATDVPLAVTGIVRVKADAAFGAIQPGDLLTSSPTPGHAMRCEPLDCGGAVIGKAIDGLGEGAGRIRMLVSLG